MKAKRILIADDDATLVRILEVRLRNLGFQTQASHDAMHALTLIHKNPPDLVVIDIAMPAGDGLAVCQMLGSDQRLHDIPIIVLTGRSDHKTVDRCSDLGARLIIKNGHVWDNLRANIRDIFGDVKACA